MMDPPSSNKDKPLVVGGVGTNSRKAVVRNNNGTTVATTTTTTTSTTTTTTTNATTSNDKTRRRRKRKGVIQQRFSDYLVFGFPATVCLGLFVLCYAIVLIVIWPLLTIQEPHDLQEESAADYIHHPHVPQTLKEAHLGGHLKEEVHEMASAAKYKLDQFRKGKGVTDVALLDQAKIEFDNRKKQPQNQQQRNGQQQQLRGGGGGGANNNNVVPIVAGGGGENKDKKQVTGFIVLGMHRSGTSMLSGLLHTSCGYNVGGPLIGSAFDNEKGFFELIDIVLQNDEFMNAQKVWWSANVIKYDWEKALRDKDEMKITFEHGDPGLTFLNNPGNSPWLQKDPRMCITLKTWLPLLNNEPAIVFTYRHPLEVAMSLKKREQNFELERGLRLWIIYNMRAIQNSKGLCVVKSSNDAILADPLNEVQRISDELTSKCNVPQPPNRMKQEDVDKFVDPKLQHNAKRRKESEAGARKVLKEYNGGSCKVYTYDSDYDSNDQSQTRERDLYLMAMKLYCDFESGKAYDDNYEWPNLAP